MNILLIRLSAVGDVVRTLPALTCLRRSFPGAHIAWAVEESSHDILADQPDLDEILVFPRRKLLRVLLHPDELASARAAFSSFARSLKEARFDLVIDFQGTFKSGMMAHMTGSARRVGLARGQAREMSYIFYNERVELPTPKMNRVDRALALVAHVGAKTDNPVSGIPERPADAAYVEGFLDSLRDSGRASGPPAVVFPGTSKVQAYKRYPAKHFARAADLLATSTGVPIVVAWGPGEEEIAGDVVSSMRSPATLSPSLTLGQLTALIRRARVFIAGDTGPMHIAWTVGTPVVAIYGPTDPELNQPGGPYSTVAYEKVFCSPCRNRGCIARTCLDSLDPAKVADAAVTVIARVRAAGAARDQRQGPVNESHGTDDTRQKYETMGPGMRPPHLDS